MIGFIWALPLTVVGLIVALVTGCERVHLRIPASTSEARTYLASDWLRKRFFGGKRNIGAFTIGCVILFRGWQDASDSKLVRHELVHVKQGQRWGPLLPLVQLWAMTRAVLEEGDFYEDNFLEREAREKSK